MIFEFKEPTYNINEHQIIHVIEHNGHGTLHHLIEPLQEDIHQHVVCTYNLVNMKFIREKFHYVIHVTGHMYPIISNLKLLLENGINVCVFIHVAPMYFILKRKDSFIDYLLSLQREYDFKCFCPSNEVAKKFGEYGLNVKGVQIGFPKIDVTSTDNVFYLKPYCNKFISICTNSDPRYIDLKGINDFIDMTEKFKIKNDALILGFDGMYRGVKCKRLDLNSFLYVLSNSKAYIQFSKTEAYNLTALQSKRLKVPILVSNIDGHIDCMKYSENHIGNIVDFAEKIELASSLDCIRKNYDDSLERETLENFIIEINKNVKGV